MTGGPRQENGTVVRIEDYRRESRQQQPRPDEQPPLLAYCLTSGVIGAIAATALSLAVSGAARVAVWSAVLGSVSVLAGVAYDTHLLRAAWAAWRLLFRQRADA